MTVLHRDAVEDNKATSFGNAGVLAACSVAPVTAPGLVRKGPKLLMDPNFPLFMRWSYLPRLLPWLVKYLSHANDADTRRIAAGLAPLTTDSVEQHQQLTKGGAAEKSLRLSDYAFAYPDRASFIADSYTWKLRKEFGFEPDVIENQAVREREPALSDRYNCLAVVKDHGFLNNPSAYLSALAEDAKRVGVSFQQETVVDFELVEGRVAAVVTENRTFPCEFAVLASGVWSKTLLKKVGLKVPLESERGYHLHIKDPGSAPNIPLMITTGKFVATPMSDGLRCAGVVEFGGLNAGPSKAPLALLRKFVGDAFPDIKLENVTEWLGHRPAPSDSLPLIGEVQNTGLFVGFGHHHIGMTAGPKTGKIIAGLISGKRENLDLSPYRPERFA